jgi:protein ImuB
MIVCVHLPRFALTVAAGGPQRLAAEPLAIAPANDPHRVGEVSGAAQLAGVHAGMRLGEALARCPTLVLVPDDPVGVASAWEDAVRALEGIGAQVELSRPGLAYFDASGLRHLHVDTAGVIRAAGEALKRRPRIGAGPTRFCALAAALQARSRRAQIVDRREVRRYLARQPVSLLSHREQTAPLVALLERFGITTLGKLAGLGAGAVADRFGEPGTLARRLALGEDTPLLTRTVEEHLEESMRLGDSNSGEALTRTLGVLIDRLLARPERGGRTIRAAVLSARLVERGTWSEPVVFRQAISDRTRMRLALLGKLALLPAPAQSLSLAVQALGPAGGNQTSLLDGEHAARHERLLSAVQQVREIAGPNAVLRLTAIDERSRVIERKYDFTSYR